MKLQIGLTTVFVSLLSCLLGAVSQAAPDDLGRVVDVHQSAYHTPLFSNEIVSVLEVNFPPGRESDFHHHRFDSLNVYLVDYPANASGQTYGGPITVIREGKPLPKRGEVSFNEFSSKPIINRGVNRGTTPMRLIETHFTGNRVFGYTPADREDPAYVKLLDNARAKVWRVTLQPGEAVGAVTQKAPGMRLVIQGGEISESYPGMADRGMWLDDTKVYWQEQGVVRTLKNIGTSTVMLVEVEFK